MVYPHFSETLNSQEYSHRTHTYADIALLNILQVTLLGMSEMMIAERKFLEATLRTHVRTRAEFSRITTNSQSQLTICKRIRGELSPRMNRRRRRRRWDFYALALFHSARLQFRYVAIVKTAVHTYEKASTSREKRYARST